MHGPVGGLQNVDVVYHGLVHHLHTPGQGLLLYNGAQQVAVFFFQLLAVVEQGVGKAWRQNNRGRKHRPGIATTAGFVDAGFHNVWLMIREQHGLKVMGNALSMCKGIIICRFALLQNGLVLIELLLPEFVLLSICQY